MTGLRVEPNDLRAKATQIRNLQFSLAKDKVELSLPDILPPTKTAVENLGKNADLLYDYQIYGDRAGWRLAETLDSVAVAYEEADRQGRDRISGGGSAAGPIVPKANELPEPVLPPPLSADPPPATGYMAIDVTQAELVGGDAAASLVSAQEAWRATGNRLRADAEKFTGRIPTWEGEAAEQAYRKFAEFGEFLQKLGDSWNQLADQAQTMAIRHARAVHEHTELYNEYKKLEADYYAAAGKGGGLAHQLGEKMMDLQQRSDELRVTYASDVQPDKVAAPTAPNSTAPTAAVGGGGRSSQGGGSAGGGGAGESQAVSDPGSARTSPMSADPSQQPGGSSSGASESGGGSPSGGESGSGAGAPGLPTGDESKGLPGTTGDPRLSPAADAGHGGGSGGGGTGGGGGAGPMPLQPSVSGVAVGPSPSAGGGTSGTGAPAAASAGGMMGGMGGMAPMGGQGAAGGAGEKKRTPGLAPDEELYTEDRPHTEGIIGRPERRAGQGKRDST